MDSTDALSRYIYRIAGIFRGVIGASVSEPPLVDSTDALSRYIYIYIYILSGAYEPPKAARSVQLRIIAQNGVCIYSST